MPNQSKPGWMQPSPKPHVPVNKPAVGALNNITFKQPGAFHAAPVPAFPPPPGWNPKTGRREKIGGKTRRARRNKRSSTRKHSGGWW